MLRLAILLACVTAGHACSVPVYRYALERWETDPHLLVQWGGDAEATGKQFVAEAPLEARAATAEDAAPSAATRPWARISFPQEGPAWFDGPLPELRRLWTSPARSELVRRIHTGETVIFLVVTSGDAQRDQPVLDRIAARTAHLARIIELPAQEEGDDEPGPGKLRTHAIPLRIAFSTLPVRHDDAAEAELIAQLRALAPKDAQLPYVAPVYGRARVLAVYGQDVAERQIDEDCFFVSGSCSCEIKDENPGVDLLLHADWETLLETPPPGVAPKPAEAPRP